MTFTAADYRSTAKAVYLACDKSIADDLSTKLQQAAEQAEQFAQIRALASQQVGCRTGYLHFCANCGIKWDGSELRAILDAPEGEK